MINDSGGNPALPDFYWSFWDKASRVFWRWRVFTNPVEFWWCDFLIKAPMARPTIRRPSGASFLPEGRSLFVLSKVADTQKAAEKNRQKSCFFRRLSIIKIFIFSVERNNAKNA